jgi:hypothetical protein
MNREVLFEIWKQGSPSCVVGGYSVDEHNRWAVATRPVHDLSAIPRHEAGLDFSVGGHLSALPASCLSWYQTPAAGSHQTTGPYSGANTGYSAGVHRRDHQGKLVDLAIPQLRRPAGKIKLAQTVSRFCNAEDGGLVVIGMSTKRVPGGEDIRGLCPVPRDKGMLRRYQYAFEKCLFPPPDHLSIEAIEIADDGMLILIDVSPQPEELKPFLVHGAIVDGGVEGAFISIVRRRGESSIPITAPMIHSTLAAGRALLRRGELPRDS